MRTTAEAFSAKIIFQEQNVPLMNPVYFLGGAHAIVETQCLGVFLSRIRVPLSVLSTTVAIWIFVLKPDKLFLRLPFFPARRILANQEEIWGVHHRQAAARRAEIAQLDRRWLVVKLQHRVVVLHLVNAGELDTMAFELDREAHLPAGVASAHVPGATAHLPCRLRGAHLIDYRPSLPGNVQLRIPG